MRRFSPGRYSFGMILFVVLVIVVFNASNWYIYSKIRSYLIGQLGQRLANIASATAFGLNLEKVLKAREKTVAYEEIKNLLNNVKEDNQLVDIFILDLDYNNILNPPADSGSEVFLNLDLAAITQAMAGTKAYSHLYQVGDYFFESGFAPIYDSEGKVIAVLGVEAGADFFKVLSNFKKTIIGAFVLSLLGMILLAVLFWNITAHLRKMEHTVVRTSALQAMGEMVASICHEIRNPLGIIKGTAERLRSANQKNRDELLDFIPEEVDRLNDILTGYLEFASLEPKRKERLDITPLVTKIVEQLKGTFSKSQIQVLLNTEDDLPQVEVNPGGIRQIIINLLMNAKDAIQRSGVVNIRLKRQDRFVQLEIEDNGRGIRKKDLKQIFNPFFSTKSKGSGLGLYVVQKIVKEHQGAITVESKPGQGTKVVIKLPIGSTD